jgi:probable HAF family extracellular repeat protein
LKSKTLCITTLTLLTALSVPIRLAAQDKQEHHHNHVRYTVTDLGTLGGGFSEGVGINNRGSVSGNSYLPGDAVVHGFFGQKGVMTDLGTLGGPNSVAPEVGPPNNRGEVAGFSDTLTLDPNAEHCFGGNFGEIFPTPYTCLPFVWRDGVMTALPTLGGNNGVAAAINNRGQVAGTAENATRDPTCPFLHFEPVIWGKDQIPIQLPTVSGDADGIADGINGKGQAVGWTGPCAPVHAVLWEKGKATDLGTLGGAVLNIAFGINNRGQVVGESDLPGDTTHHAFLWQNGMMTDLGTLPGLPNSLAFSINNQGQVVGFSQDLNGNISSAVAWIWQDGVLTDINTLITSDSPLFLAEALGINDRGQIAGFAFDTSTGKAPAFLAIPCDEEKNAHEEGCEDGAEATTAARGETSQRPNVVLPENVRRMLRQRLGSRYHIPGIVASPRD